jgi:hypothetical protein
MKAVIYVALLAIALTAAPGSARGHHSYNHSRTHRSESAKREFERMSGYPHGRPGYVVDHVVPLACAGIDAPSNMQWQTITAGKAKDKWERKGCSRK